MITLPIHIRTFTDKLERAQKSL